MKKIAIIGDGGWGTALALVLHRHNHPVTIWSPFPDYLETIRQQGENIKFLPGIPLPTAIEWTSRYEDISRADAIVLASPSKYFRSVLATLASHIRPDQPV